MADPLLKGIDVSYAQGKIDWAKVKKSEAVDFAIVRAGYGWDNDKQIDTQLRANTSGCLANQIPFGLFHYSYAWSIEDARCEARWFLKTVEGLKPEFPLFWDYEEAFQIGGAGKEGFSLAKQMDMIDAWMEIVKNAGCFAGLYSTASAIKQLRNAFPKRMEPYTIWVAHVGVPAPMTSGAIWQYSWKGRIDGIANEVDLNYAYQNFPAIIKAAARNGWSKPLPPSNADPLSLSRAEYAAALTAHQATLDLLKKFLPQ